MRNLPRLTERRGQAWRTNKNTSGNLGQLLIASDAARTRELFAPGQPIYDEGDRADAAFYIESGRVKITSISLGGKEAVVAVRRNGDFLGTRCLVEKRTGSATAIVACSLIRISRGALMRLLREEPDFAVAFVVHLVEQNIRDRETLIDHLTHPAEKRLARTLLRLAEGSDDGGLHPIAIGINQNTLANMVGTTRSRVSFFMNKFKREGHIDYGRDGRVRVYPSLQRDVLGE